MVKYFYIQLDFVLIVNFIYGFTIKGDLSKLIWAINCCICLYGAYGFWRQRLIAWKIIFFYTIFHLGNMVVTYFFVPFNKRLKILPEGEVPINFEPSGQIPMFLGLITIQLIFLFYLYKRKNHFV